MQVVRELFWGKRPLGDLVGKGDAEYEKARVLFDRKAEAFEKRLGAEMAEDFSELMELRTECACTEQESAFALGCGFALQLMLETLPLIQTET